MLVMFLLFLLSLLMSLPLVEMFSTERVLPPQRFKGTQLKLLFQERVILLEKPYLRTKLEAIFAITNDFFG